MPDELKPLVDLLKSCYQGYIVSMVKDAVTSAVPCNYETVLKVMQGFFTNADLAGRTKFFKSTCDQVLKALCLNSLLPEEQVHLIKSVQEFKKGGYFDAVNWSDKFLEISNEPSYFDKK